MPMHAVCLSLLLSAAPVMPQLDDLELRDYRGAVRKLSDWHDQRLVVFVFLGVDCPLVKLYAPRLNDLSREFESRGVVIVGVNANHHDTLADAARYAKQHEIRFPLLKDAGGLLPDRLVATRTPEAVVLDEERRIRYQGRIDDQYTVTTHRPRPTRRDLAEAIEDLLARREVRVPRTEATGCFIDRQQSPASTGRITWTKHIEPILQKHCQACHRPGQIGPFSLLTYQDALGWADTIVEVTREGRMPPWHASPEHGRFANDPRLSDADRQRLAGWLEAGCPDGRSEDRPPPVRFSDDWNIGEPDLVVKMPQPFAVPAEGVVEYQNIEVDPGFTEDRWIRAAEIRPGNRAVVHHCNVFLKPPGAPDIATQGKLGSVCLAAMAPGTPPLLLPDGMAKLVPAGWKIVFVMHYTPIGTPQTDQTSLGLIFADPKQVRKEVATMLLYDPDLRIPPGANAHRVEKTWQAPADVLLLAFFPHMHLRGRSFRYEAELPDGTRQILLDVPRWDFNWQNRYVLAEPLRLPQGTVIRCTAVYDNSADNPANPDPGVEVKAGPQSWDEMFNGYFEWAMADQDLTRPPSPREVALRALGWLTRPLVMAPLLLAVGLLWLRQRRQASLQRSGGA
jgi:peroxiredoxin